MNDLKAAVRYFEMLWEGKTDFEALAMLDRRVMEGTALSALREAMDRQEGCKHCSWIDTSRQHEDEDGIINYCKVCGRRLIPDTEG